MGAFHTCRLLHRKPSYVVGAFVIALFCLFVFVYLVIYHMT